MMPYCPENTPHSAVHLSFLPCFFHLKITCFAFVLACLFGMCMTSMLLACILPMTGSPVHAGEPAPVAEPQLSKEQLEDEGYPEEIIEALLAGTTLTKIDLSGCGIYNFEPLARLQPEELILDECDLGGVVDFFQLQKLKTLKKLNLAHTGFNDLRLLQGLDRLEELDINATKVTDFQPLLEMTSLRSLCVGGRNACYNDNVEIYGKMNLRELIIILDGQDQVIDWSRFRNFERLEILQLHLIHNLDCEKIAHFPLKLLAIRACPGTLNLSAVGKMKTLSKLAILDMPIETIDFIKGLSLKALSLARCGNLKDISPVAAMTELEVLSISHTAVSSLAPIAKLPKLRELYIYGCDEIHDLRPLRGMKSLQEVDVDYTKFSGMTLSEIVEAE